MLDAGSRRDSFVADAAGAEFLTFEELLRMLAPAVVAHVGIVRAPPSLGFALTGLVGLPLCEVVLTRDEVDGLMAGFVTSDELPKGATR